MSFEFTFKLEKKAKSAGGDKYVCETQNEFNIYVPQTISRMSRKGIPSETLQIIIKPKDDTDDTKENEKK